MISRGVGAQPSQALPAAIVLDASSAAGLGVIRSLGAHGIPIICLDPQPRAAGFRSRYAKGLQSPDPRLDASAFLAFLLEVAADLPQKAVLFPAGDASLRALSSDPDLVTGSFVLPVALMAGGPAGPDALRRAAQGAGLTWADDGPVTDEIWTHGSYFDRHSRVLAGFTARVRRHHASMSRRHGTAVSQWQADVAQSATRVLKQLRFHGTSLVAFVRDEAGGLRPLAFTPCHWSWHGLAAASGVDLSLTAYRDAIGKSYVARRQTDGARWAISLGEVTGGAPGDEGAPIAVPAITRDGVLSLTDPVPAAVTLVQAARRRLARR